MKIVPPSLSLSVIKQMIPVIFNSVCSVKEDNYQESVIQDTGCLYNIMLLGVGKTC